jgi:hypothetical protein
MYSQGYIIRFDSPPTATALAPAEQVLHLRGSAKSSDSACFSRVQREVAEPLSNNGTSQEKLDTPADLSAPEDCCLACKRCRRPGRIYFFYAAHVQGLAYQVVHQEGVFICHRCVKDHLDLSAWWIVCHMILVAGFGFVAMVFLAVLRLPFVPLAALVITVLRLVRHARRLNISVRKLYLVDSYAAHLVTRWAIQMRRQAVLKTLALPEIQIVFLSQEEHRAKLKARLG